MFLRIIYKFLDLIPVSEYLLSGMLDNDIVIRYLLLFISWVFQVFMNYEKIENRRKGSRIFLFW